MAVAWGVTTCRSRICVAGSGSTPSSSSMARARSVADVGALLVVGAEGGGDGEAVGSFGVGVEGEGTLGVDERVRGLTANEAKLAELQQAVELQQPDASRSRARARATAARSASGSPRHHAVAASRSAIVRSGSARSRLSSASRRSRRSSHRSTTRWSDGVQRDRGRVGAEMERRFAGGPLRFEQLAQVRQRHPEVPRAVARRRGRARAGRWRVPG